MQYLLIIADTMSNIDIDAELTTLLCSVIVFFVLMGVRNNWKNKQVKTRKHVELYVNESTEKRDTDTHYDAHHVQTDAALRTAFEEEDYWQVLQCWKTLKYSHQSSIHLPMVIRSMRSCNKGAYFIVTELRNYFKAHPKMRSIGIINDLLEPLTRRADDAQLVDLLVKMIPTVNLVKDSRTYEVLLSMHASSGNLAKMQEIIAEMKSKEVAFTPCATVSVVTMGLQMGNCDVVMKAFGKLKAAWDVRSTWAVSVFALESHKTKILLQIAELACQKYMVAELSSACAGMTLPEEVLDAVQGQICLMADVDVAATTAAIEKSEPNLKADAIYNLLVGHLKSCTKMSALHAPWRKPQRADSDASTSEGSMSDSEEEVQTSRGFSPPPGLAPPPGF